MNKTIKCPECRLKVVLNDDKHKFRPKWCPRCKNVIANQSFKKRLLSIFQRRKKERKQRTRERYINRETAKGRPLKVVLRELPKIFEWEEQ